MKLIRWVEQHIRGGRKKDKEDKDKGKQSKKNRKFQRGLVEAGPIVKLQEHQLQNSLREQTSSVVESLLGPLYTAREQTAAKTEISFKEIHNSAAASGEAAHLNHYAFEESQQTEGGLYSEIPDTPPPPAPPSIANRIPLQHIRCIGQSAAQCAVGDGNNQLQPIASSETPRERSRIKTNPWFVSSPQSPCCSSSTSGDSGAWTATSSDRSGRTAHAQEGQTPQDNASHDWYYADSSSSTASLSRKATASKTCQLYQNVLPLEERILAMQRSGKGRVLHRYPSGTHISTASNLNRYFQRRPESARTYRKSYFMNHCEYDPPDLTSSEDEAYCDDYLTESGASDFSSVRKRLAQEESRIKAALPSAVSANTVRDVLDNKIEVRQSVPGRRTTQAQKYFNTSGVPDKHGPETCFGNSSPVRAARLRDERVRTPKVVERQISQQENFLLHRELLQFKQFLLMRTLENMGSELNMNRGRSFNSPQLRQRNFYGHLDHQVLQPPNGLRQQPVANRLVQTNSPRVTSHQSSRGPPQQSPRLTPSTTCSPLKDLRASRSFQMSPRTPRLGRQVTYQRDQSALIAPYELGLEPINHLSALSTNSKRLRSPKLDMRPNPSSSPLTPRMARPLYAMPKGVPRTTTIDFQAFTSPSRKQSAETA